MRSDLRQADRGHVLTLLMLAVVVLVGLATLLGNRFAAAAADRRESDRRNQALWLARSAVSLAQPGERTVEAAGATARVSVKVAQVPAGKHVEAEAVLGIHTARVDATLGPDGNPVAWTETASR